MIRQIVVHLVPHYNMHRCGRRNDSLYWQTTRHIHATSCIRRIWMNRISFAHVLRTSLHIIIEWWNYWPWSFSSAETTCERAAGSTAGSLKTTIASRIRARWVISGVIGPPLVRVPYIETDLDKSMWNILSPPILSKRLLWFYRMWPIGTCRTRNINLRRYLHISSLQSDGSTHWRTVPGTLRSRRWIYRNDHDTCLWCILSPSPLLYLDR